VKRLLLVVAFLGALSLGTWWLLRQSRSAAILPPKPRSLADALSAIELTVEPRVRAFCKRAGVVYPPERLVFIAYKKERRIDLLVPQDGRYRLVHSWPVLAASGGPGPKLREGDRQVPEGFYRFELLNPNSRFHLSLRVNYPNAEDVARGAAEGVPPQDLGSDIMVHGGAVSIGCLAVGDPGVEEIFLLVSRVGLENVEILIVPDERMMTEDERPWVQDLYARLRTRLQQLR